MERGKVVSKGEGVDESYVFINQLNTELKANDNPQSRMSGQGRILGRDYSRATPQ